MDPNAVNEELKKARETHVVAVVVQLHTELQKKLAFENARAMAASKGNGEKAPSEAACERAAKTDPEYLKLCGAEVSATEAVLRADVQVEYLRKKFEATMAIAAMAKA
jgi:hypothetical protein